MKKKIIDVTSEVFQVPVTEETTQNNCDKWDSLHHLNLIVALEEMFDVSFEPEEIAVMKSIRDIEKMLESKQK